MTTVTYNAQRSLISGHVLGNVYSLELRCVLPYPLRGRKVGREEQRTLNDTAEVLYYYGKATWSVLAHARNGTELAALREFLDSTEAGELFTFDEFGTIASPGTTLYTARRANPDYAEQPIAGSGTSRADSATQVSFTVEQAS